MGIELAHSEGQFVIDFLWDEEILRQHKSTFVDPAAGGQRLSARDTGSGYPDTQITEMSTSR